MNALGCTCGYIKKISAEALMSDEIVFSGKIIDLEIKYATYKNKKWPTDKIATFVVDTWFSSQEISDTVIVNTGGGGGDCGLFFNRDETWLIYADSYDGVFHSSICTASINSKQDGFKGALKYLTELKSKSGKIKEVLELDWSNDTYILSGQLVNGKPVGQWLRVRNNDTIAVINFNNEGKRQGYQMEKNDDWEQRFETFYETTDKYVKIYNLKKDLLEFYEIYRGRRNGKYEIFWDNKIHLKANYKNGRLSGDWTSWHEDTAIAKGQIRTMKVFDNDKLLTSIRIDEATGKQIE